MRTVLDYWLLTETSGRYLRRSSDLWFVIRDVADMIMMADEDDDSFF